MAAADDLTTTDAWAEAARLAGDDSATQVRNSIYNAATVNADQAARANVAARFLAIPPESAAAHPDDVARQMRVMQTDAPSLVAKNPVLTRTLADQNQANAIHDDLPNAASIERVLTPVARAANYLVSKGDGPTLLGDLGVVARSANAAVSPVFKKVFQAAAAPLAGVDALAGTQLADAPFAAARWFDDIAEGSPVDQRAPLVTKLAHALGTTGGLIMEALATGGESAAVGPGTSAAQAIGQGIAHGVRAMLVPSSIASQDTAQQVLAQGGSASDAVRAGVASYLTNTAGGIFPFATAGSLATRLLTGGAMGYATSDVSRKLMNAALPDAMQQPAPTAEDRILDIASGMLFGGMVGPKAPAYELARDVVQSHQAEQDFQRLSTLGQLSATSKWRERDPEGFREFVRTAAVTEDGDLPYVYIEAKAFAQGAAKAGVTPEHIQEALPDVARQLPEATMTDGYIRIPTEDYATSIAGGPLDAELRQQLKPDPEGKTFAEAQAFYQEQAQRMQEAARQLVRGKQEQDAFRESQARVQQALEEQLAQAGRYTPDVNRVNAAISTAFLSRLAARMEITPEEAFQRFAPRLAGGALSGAFEQSMRDNPEFRKWFGASAAVDDSGQPKIVYHGTADDFNAFSATEAGKNVRTAASRTGFFFTDRPDLAQRYAEMREGTQQIMPVYLSMQDPVRATVGNMKEADDFLAKGYKGDGAIVTVERPDGSKQTVYAVKAPEQIKSAIGNRGTFDPKDASILHQEGNNIVRGGYEPSTGTIGLTRNADLTTYLHETGHWALDTYIRIAGAPDAPPEIRADVDQVFKKYGIESLEKWNSMSLDEQRPYHERFAREFEQYLMEGKAPSQELQPFFQRIRAWMVSIYRSLSGLGVQLSPEVRQVFDRMLASDDAVREAQAARVFEPLFKEKPAGMSAEDWAAYQDLGAQATNDAVQAMQDKSMRDMQWLASSKAKAKKQLNREARQARDAIQREVEDEVGQMPVYRAEGELKAGPLKLSIESLERRYMGEGDRYALLDWKPLVEQKLAGRDGMDIELAAERYGFASGDELVRALLSREPRDSVVEGLTDRYMLERHGELSSPEAIEAAANLAVHNDARARFMATGLKVLTDSPISARALVNGAREAAESAIGVLRVRELNPRQYLAAETRANREALRLAPKDPQGAALAQRSALLNNQLVKAAYEAQDAVRKAVEYAKSFDRHAKRLKIDPEERDLIDSLLQRFDFRTQPTDGPSKQQIQLAQWVESQKALGYTPAEVPDMLNEQVRTHYKDMTIEQLRGLMDTVRSIEKIGREKSRITVDGKRVEVEEAIAPMLEKMRERGEKFTEAYIAEGGLRAGVDPLWRVTLDRLGILLRKGVSELTRPDYKANKYDQHELLGPFQKTVTERLIGAAYRFGDYMDGLASLKREGMKAAGLDSEWQKSLDEVVSDHSLMDNSLEVPQPRRLTRGDLIGIAMHVGNESNFDKLVHGMRWEPQAIWRALHDHMREKDWAAARLMGEMAGKHWDEMAAMNRRLGNDTPTKIEPRPFQTKYGEMPGWYAPIDYDPVRSRLGAKKAEERAVDPQKGLFGRDYYRADTTTNGSLNARAAGYYDFIDLNWRPIERRITDTMRDLAFREALIDAHKVYANKAFRKQFERTFGPEEYKHFGDWLGRLVNSEVGDERQSVLTAVAANSRRALVANGIAFRISTMLKHGGSAGAKSAGWLAGGGQKYFVQRLARMSVNYGNEVADALAKFPEIRQRLRQQDRDFSRAIGSIMEPESIHGKAERFGHAGVAWLDFLTAVPTAHAAYDWAVTEGIPKRLGGTGKPMSEQDAILFASKVVREAHSSTNEASQSLLITNRSEIVKMLTTLHGFMNNAFGQNVDALDKLLHANGFGKPELLARVMMAQVVPALMAGWVTYGAWKDDEGPLMWAVHHIGGEFAGMLPMVREGWSAVVEGHDSAGLPAWIRAIGDVYKGAKALVKTSEGEEVKHPIRDMGNAVGLFLPGMGQLGATAQFIYDVHAGKQHPETVGDWIRGVMTGKSETGH